MISLDFLFKVMLFANFDLPVISSNDFPCKATILLISV